MTNNQQELEEQKSNVRTKKIRVVKNYENRTYEDKKFYDNDAFFSEQYRQVARCVDNIVSVSNGFDEEHANVTDDMEMRSALMGYSNNIIAFCGRRGSGKTSMMITLAGVLKKIKTEGNKSFWNEAHSMNGPVSDESDSLVPDKKYNVLDPIDPTTMKSDTSVISVILHKMLDNFQNKWKNEEDIEKEEKKDQVPKVLMAFQKVFKELESLKRDDADRMQDSLTEISEIGDSSGLRFSFNALVRVYLKYIDNDFLVIQVDDTDMNPSRAYEVSEDIRKYCVMPKVIVLTAVHMNTLRRCIEQEYVKMYNNLLLSTLSTNKLPSYKCGELAERYIEKLIPGKHQIHLSSFDEKILQRFYEYELEYLSAPTGDDYLKRTNDNDVDASSLYENRLFRLIYEKTGVVLLDTGEYHHYFLPKRFRELTHFLSYFNDLDDINVDAKGSITSLLEAAYSGDETKRYEAMNQLVLRMKNLDHLETYFYQHWCTTTLTIHEFETLDKILKAPLAQKNHVTITALKSYCLMDRALNRSVEKTLFSSEEVSNESYGSIMYLLYELNLQLKTHAKMEFIYAVKMSYTIYMNKLVCSAMMRLLTDNPKLITNPFADILKFLQGTLFVSDVKHLPEKGMHENVDFSKYHFSSQLWFRCQNLYPIPFLF